MLLSEPVFVPLDGPVPEHASSEFRVHLEMYRNTPYRAVVHAHPPAAIAASLVMDTIVPEDSEGTMFCPVIPVVPGARVPRRSRIMWPVHSRLQNWSSCGATVPLLPGRTLDEAYVYTSLAEHSCRVLAMKQNFVAQQVVRQDVAWMKEVRPHLAPKSAVVMKVAEVYHVKPGADAGKKTL